MKLTRSWLEHYIDVPFNTNKLCDHLTMAGLEVDSTTDIKNDSIIDIDLTPNRADCLSVYGIARELSSIDKAYKFKKYKKPQVISATCSNPKIKFNVLEKKLCPRYGYMYLENITSTSKTPLYISNRLESIGIKAINPIVDILNYIMIDIGQPMHAYDADKLDGEVFIRMAKNKEIIKALDDNNYKLNQENVVISDKREIISLAGIIGSKDCSVTSKTKNVIVESAFFAPEALSNKARKLKIQTESSHRYERGVDSSLPEEALIALSNIIFENKICSFSEINLIENKEFLPKKNPVKIDHEMIRRVLGINITDKDILNIFISLGCEYDDKKDCVLNPTYRYDLKNHSDYIEEVARIFGYDNIPIESEKLGIEPSSKYLSFKIVDDIRQYLYKNSYSECINYSFVNNDELENMSWKHEEFNNHVKILNYMSSEQNKLRSNLVSSLIKNIEHNSNVNSEISYRFFEISNIFDIKFDQILSCVVSGEKYEEQWASKNTKFDEYDMTTLVDDIAKLFGLQKNNINYIIDKILNKNKEYIVLSLSISDLVKSIREIPKEKFINYSKLPYIRRDLSFVIDDSIVYKEILNVVKKTNVHSLKKILLFDLYIGKNIPVGKKSLGMGFIFQDKVKTLTHEEADSCMSKILRSLEDNFKIELRK